MPGLVPGIYVFLSYATKTWMAGTSPAMTVDECNDESGERSGQFFAAITSFTAPTQPVWVRSKTMPSGS